MGRGLTYFIRGSLSGGFCNGRIFCSVVLRRDFGRGVLAWGFNPGRFNPGCPGGFWRRDFGGGGGGFGGGFCPGWFCPGSFVWEGFVQGGFVHWSFVRGVLAGGFSGGSVLVGGFCPGEFLYGGFV